MTIVQGHINTAMSSFAAGTAKNLKANMIGEIVAPPISVSQLSDAYLIYDAADLRLDAQNYTGGAQVNRVEWTESESSYRCLEYALEGKIPNIKLKNSDAAMRLQQRVTAGLVNKLLLGYEKRVADILFSGSTFTNTAALSGTDRWDTDTSNPVAKVADAKEAIRALIGIEPNTVVMGAAVWADLRLHADITSRVAGLVSGTPATEAQAATALGVDRVIVGRAIYNTAAEGATASYSDVWGKSVSVCYIDPASPTSAEGVITPMQTFVCEIDGSRYSVTEYDEKQTRSRILQCYDCTDEVAVAVNSAYLYTTVVS